MPNFQKEKDMNDIETSEITTSPKVRALIVAGVAGGTGTGFFHKQSILIMPYWGSPQKTDYLG